jgi:putative Mn2+ efflux pump MntP
MSERKSRFTWSNLLIIVWFVVFVTFYMVFRGLGFLGALSQFLTPINIVLSVVVIFGILGIQSFISGFRGKKSE